MSLKLFCLTLIFALCTNVVSADVVTLADFNASGTGTVTSMKLNDGTTGGTWSVGAVEESIFIQESGNASNLALVGDRGPYAYTLDFDSAVSLGSGLGRFSYDTYLIRTIGTADRKPNTLTGYDSLGTEVFQIVLQTGTGGANARGSLNYVNSLGTEVLLIEDRASVSGNPIAFNVANFDTVRIDFDATTMDIFVNNGLASALSVAYRNPGVLDLASITLTGNGTASPGFDDNNDAGAYYDNIRLETIPEPSSLLLVSLMTGIGIYTRRRSLKKKSN